MISARASKATFGKIAGLTPSRQIRCNAEAAKVLFPVVLRTCCAAAEVTQLDLVWLWEFFFGIHASSNNQKLIYLYTRIA
jgi:hypothetical protein